MHGLVRRTSATRSKDHTHTRNNVSRDNVSGLLLRCPYLLESNMKLQVAVTSVLMYAVKNNCGYYYGPVDCPVLIQFNKPFDVAEESEFKA